MSITNPTPEERSAAVSVASQARSDMLAVFGQEEPPGEPNSPDPTLGQKVIDACDTLIAQW